MCEERSNNSDLFLLVTWPVRNLTSAADEVSLCAYSVIILEAEINVCSHTNVINLKPIYFFKYWSDYETRTVRVTRHEDVISS